VVVRRRGVSEGQFGRGGVVGLVVGGLDLRASLFDEFQRILVGAGAWHGGTSAFGYDSDFNSMRINSMMKAMIIRLVITCLYIVAELRPLRRYPNISRS
jgi:hypothetical protein